jgi:hypothetical protein
MQVPIATDGSNAIDRRRFDHHEVDSLETADPSDRCFVTRAGDKNLVTVMFGDGVHGMRLRTGVENVGTIDAPSWPPDRADWLS